MYLNIYEEYKTECEARGPDWTERDNRFAHSIGALKFACCARWKCAREAWVFFINVNQTLIQFSESVKSDRF